MIELVVTKLAAICLARERRKGMVEGRERQKEKKREEGMWWSMGMQQPVREGQNARQRHMYSSGFLLRRHHLLETVIISWI